MICKFCLLTKVFVDLIVFSFVRWQVNRATFLLLSSVGHFKSFRMVLYSLLTKRATRLCTLSMFFICYRITKFQAFCGKPRPSKLSDLLCKRVEDSLAKSILPHDFTQFRALRNRGDGNCLFNSTSISLQGDEKLAGILCLLVPCKLLVHLKFYASSTWWHDKCQKWLCQKQFDMGASQWPNGIRCVRC